MSSSGAASARSSPPPLRFFDICANLLDDQFSGIYNGKAKHVGDLDAVLRRARAAGVDTILVAAGSLSEARAARALCASACADWPRLLYSVGVHPTRTGEIAAFADGGAAGYARALAAEVEAGAAEGSVAAVGEFGLDFERESFAPRETQLAHLGLH